MEHSPSAYQEGYAQARIFDHAAADNYIRHTTMGDTVLDPIMGELSSLPPSDLHRFIWTGIENRDEGLRNAPRILCDFFDSLEEPPWLDHEAFRPGIRAFHKNVDLMLVAFVTGVLVEGFSTLIAKYFNITGRVATTKRRLQQNNRHIMDIFFPGGLRRDGDGWKLSTRIRFVHARIRAMLAKSDDWKHEIWGPPVSAVHLGLPSPSFPSACRSTRRCWARISTKKNKRAFLAFGATPAASWGYLNPFSIPTLRRRQRYTRSAICANHRRTPIR